MGTYAQAVHGLKVCVIPDPDNDFRPLALRHKPLAFVSTLLIIAKIAAASLIALLPTSAELSTITSARIVEFTNAERKKAGLFTLAVNSALANAAQQKAQDMLDKDYFAHISPIGVTPWFWMAKVGYEYEIAGENLAIDFTEAEDVVAAWLASPTHRDNLLLPAYTQTGVAVATGEFQGGTSTVVVHMFGKPVDKQTAGTTSPVPSAAPTPAPVVPAPAPAPSDTTPPRVPRIALAGLPAGQAGNLEVVKTEVDVTVDGEPGSTVRILVNNQVRNNLYVPNSGTAVVHIGISALPEGTFFVRAYALDSARNESEFSEALALTKDTVGPLIDEKELAFALAPTFDTAHIALFIPGREVAVSGQQNGWRVVGAAQEPISITLQDQFGNESVLKNISFAPAFASEGVSEIRLPSHVQQFARRVSAALAVLLMILLLISVFIRIRVQRPALIAHASAVIALAFILFLI